MEKVTRTLGYILIEEEKERFQGAAMITDSRGIPLDFRYTDPVRPTRLERVLYGEALEIYLREEILLKNLLKAVEIRPHLWLCRDRDLLQPLADQGVHPVVMIEQTGYAPLENVGQTQPQGEGTSFLLQADPVSAPLRVTTPEGGPGVDDLVPILLEVARSMELVEPFVRMRRALEIVGEDRRGD